MAGTFGCTGTTWEEISRWYFPSHIRPDQPYDNLYKAFDRICKTADVKDITIHDLRHTFASILYNNGHELTIIGDMLGHSDPKTTQGYTHLFSSKKQQLNNEVNSMFSEYFQLPNDSKVVHINAWKKK